MNENSNLTDINAPIDELHRDCLEAVAMIRSKHAESRFKLSLGYPGRNAPTTTEKREQ